MRREREIVRWIARLGAVSVEQIGSRSHSGAWRRSSALGGAPDTSRAASTSAPPALPTRPLRARSGGCGLRRGSALLSYAWWFHDDQAAQATRGGASATRGSRDARTPPDGGRRRPLACVGRGLGARARGRAWRGQDRARPAVAASVQTSRSRAVDRGASPAAADRGVSYTDKNRRTREASAATR